MIGLERLGRRYLFTGVVRLTTGLHIGGGRPDLGASDNPVIRGVDGLPYIPGSSMKGAFRATVERLAPVIPGVTSCGLLPESGCPGALKSQRVPELETLDDRALLDALDGKLCDTCQLFGSPYLRSKIDFADLPLTDSTLPESVAVEVRDGVAIDRDRETAVDRLKYDFEAVPAGLTFSLRLTLSVAGGDEQRAARDLGLTCLGLAEYANGFGELGGKRSRGLGKCQLDDLAIFVLDLEEGRAEDRVRRLRDYLVRQEMRPVEDWRAFITEAIDALIARAEA
ncbi:MAG: CRISPR-associated RAMP protein [Dehalococcoidia bacterium]|nr:MAG: CRISPR-associated RAMP protein [Dehalococcoidia bacterium]